MRNSRSVICVAFVVFVVMCGLQLMPQRSSARSVKSPSTVFSNSTGITINAPTATTAPTVASPYPSNITVSGMTGNITNVEVTLTGLSTTRMTDLDMLLVSPTGAKYIFLADATVTNPSVLITDKTYTFRDSAATSFPLSPPEPASGAYRPTSGDSTADTFPAPAPAGPYSQPTASTFASVFNGADPNGVWSLYIADDTVGNPGNISSGWGLTITTTGSPVTFTNNSYIVINDITQPADPYGTAITVSGTTGVVSHLSVTLTGYNEANSSNVDVLLVNPSGKALIMMSDAGGSGAATNANLTFDDAASSILNSPVTGTYKPTDISSESFDTFPAPAPPRPYNAGSASGLAVFNGSPANGDWRLYVINDSTGGAGSITGGWSIDITTGPPDTPTPLGCFTPSFAGTNFGTGINPTNVAVADFNNDNKPDLAVTNQVSNDISILLGNGNGTFAAQSLITAGGGPYAIVAGKFNADTNFDLAVVNSTSNNVSILTGNGNGTFSAPTNFFVGASPISIAVGDLNNDTFQDLVVANFGGFFSGSISVLLGNGAGSFTATNPVRTRTEPAFVLITSLNGDGNKDLVVANFGSNSVSTFFGQGNGTFLLSQNLNVGNGPVAVHTIDAVGGGTPTLLVANFNGDSITNCPITGLGTYGPCVNGAQPFSPNPVSIASGDFLGSGSSMFAAALSGSNLIKMSTSLTFNVGANPNALATADFNNDGKTDLVSVNSGSNDVSVMMNNCKVAKGNLSDFNGDRRTEPAIYRPSTTQWWVSSLSIGNPVVSFGHPTDIVVSGDFDGDRLSDFSIFRPDTGVWAALDHNLRPIHFIQFGQAGDIPVAADYDGDAKTDIAVYRPSEGRFYIRRSSDNAWLFYTWGMSGDKPVPADYDGDGKDDVAVYRPSTGVWYIVKSSDGLFITTMFGIAEDKTVPGDYDGDGKADIAVWRPSTGVWWVLRSSDGGFSAMAFGTSTDIPLVGDFVDADGKYDYAVWRPSDGVWYSWRASDMTTSTFIWGIPGDTPIPSTLVR